MPGPNDHHIEMEKDAESKLRPVLKEGLGADEPSEERRAGMRAAGAKKVEELRKKLEAQGAEVLEKERALGARQQELDARERDLQMREQALARALAQAEQEHGAAE